MNSSGKHSPQLKMFINFHEDSLSSQFVGHLVADLKSHLCIDVEKRGEDFAEHIQRIKESKIAIVIFSSMYTKSSWCLNELVEITKGVEEGKLVVIPILYKLDASVVKGLEGDFGLNLWNHVKRTSEFDKLKKWKEALDVISHKLTLVLTEDSDETEFITGIVKEVKTQLPRIPTDQQKYAFTDASFSRTEELKTADSETDIGILCDTKSGVNREEAKSFQCEAEFYGKSKKDDNLLDAADSDATPGLHNIVESKRVESVKHVPQHQVFISFRGKDVRSNFVSHLVSAFSRHEVNVFKDKDERKDKDVGKIFKAIEDSKIAVVVFSRNYSESTWCLDELEKIIKRMHEGKLKVIPISYNVEPSQVKNLSGDFGGKLWNLWRLHRDRDIVKWKEALESIASLEAMTRFWLKEDHGSESVFVTSIVEEVKKILVKISFEEGQNPETTGLSVGRGEYPETFLNKDPLFGIEQRMEQLEQKLEFDCNETKIIGVVGMPGIGKTTLAKMIHEKWNCKFVRCVPLLEVRKKWKDYGPVWLRTTLLKVLLGTEIPVINDETTHESVKNELLQTKVLVILDDVSDKKQLEFLLGDLKWIKKGSKIVITTCDKSLLKGWADDNYLVPQMDNKEAFQLFSYHAFDNQISCPPGAVVVYNAGGNPLALKLMGSEYRGKDKTRWEHEFMRKGWKFYIDQLNEQQKDVFLDIVCYFKSEDEYFVKSILDSEDPDTTNGVSEVRDLANKFLITISDSRVEMNDLVYKLGEHLCSPRLRKYKDAMFNKFGKLEDIDTDNVRGIFIDMSGLTKSISLERMTFTNMRNLRYLKIHDSCCPRQCKPGCELNLPYGLEFPSKDVRYLHWVNYPLEELPAHFKPENLVDLRLPYSKIKRVWEGIKDTPRLKWVDLSHSRKLLNISALSKAENLQRLNLEGCTILDELPLEIQNMKSLIFLNLKGCTRLRSIPEMNLTSLEILILSDCSNLKEFQLISESIEFLHLDSTAINRLPPTIKNLKRLVLLNLKNCKLLECLPYCLGELKDLEELILSGCSKLKHLPYVKHSMKHIKILRLDRIGAQEMPNISSFVTRFEGQASESYLSPSEWPLGVSGVSLLQRLSLSGNDFVSLQTDIKKLFNLKWLDVKRCKNLRSIPMLPPRLEYFDAHGCDSLERVANPMALQVLTEPNHATFNFSNCNKLDQDAKDSIVSYTRKKSQLVLDALSRYNGGFVLEVMIGTCFPGWKVPASFSHRASGSVLKPKLPPHWSDNKFTGIALCAVILFPRNHDHVNHLLVKCNCEFKNEDGSHINFCFTIGGWSETGNIMQKIESSHVFIGYISRMDINKHGVGNNEEGCICTEVSLEFQVTDGTKEVVGCEVLMCGFSLVYSSDEKNYVIPKRVKKPKMLSSVGDEVRLKKLEKVLYSTPGETRIIGIVGEAGIDRKPLARDLFEKRGCKFPSSSFLKMSKEHQPERLRRMFLEELLNQTVSDETTHDCVKEKLLQAKSFIVLDDVSDKKQLEFLLGNLNWIKKGSKIVITTREMSVLEGFAHENKESFQLFSYHSLDGQTYGPTGTFLTLSRIANNSRGNPFLGSEHREKDEAHWEHQMQTMTRNIIKIQDNGRFSIDQRCKDVFLLAIDNLKKMGKEANNMKYIFIDMSEITKRTALERMTFANMRNLLYLKIYDSCCPRRCKANCKLFFPDGLSFTLENVQYLYWLRYPLEELPSAFKTENIVDLQLPYSEIKRVWECIKDTPRLKWVDLRNSSKLLDISSLSKAENLQRLNLEGCTSLEKLPLEIQNMKSLLFLNLRGCIRLFSLPKIDLIPLETLILTDCSSFKEIQLNSKSLKFLHLEGTSIKELPSTIKDLPRLVVLNLRNCKMLESLPNSLCELKFLEEIILYGCSALKDFPNSMNHLQTLLFDETGAKEMPKMWCFTRSEDQASADMSLQPSGSFCSLPRDVNGVYLLKRLSLSGNDFVSLQTDISELYNLKWLDVKQCKKLRSIPMLPPRLEYFDAHGCDSLEKVENPLALLPVMVTEQIHVTFNFSNCNKLDQDAKDSIISYTRKKSQLVLDSISRYSEGIAFENLIETCFPGWEVPAWFNHRAYGSVLELKLPPHWFDNRFIGIALCAVIQFTAYNDHNNLSVKCNCVFKNEDDICIPFSHTIGGWNQSSNIPQKIESSHVFIGYVRRSDVSKQEGRCAFSEASLEFQVTDGTGKVVLGCEVMKCGFYLVYAPGERENIVWDAKTVEAPKQLGKSRSDTDIQYYLSYGMLTRDDNVQFQSFRGLDTERVSNGLGEVTSFGNPRRNNDIKSQVNSNPILLGYIGLHIGLYIGLYIMVWGLGPHVIKVLGLCAYMLYNLL